MASIILAESNTDLRHTMSEKIMNSRTMQLMGVTDNGKDAYKKVLKYRPDLVLFDMLLPYYDGFTLLQKIKEELPHNTKCIVTTPMANEAIVKEFYNRGVDYIIVKPYDPETVMDKINDVIKMGETLSSYKIHKDKMDLQIARRLMDVGVPASLTGYKYIMSAIKYVMEDEAMLEGVTKLLYPKVARTHGATSQRVEKAMRHAIEVAWGKDINSILKTNLNKSLKAGKRRPTNSEFIAGITQNILLSI